MTWTAEIASVTGGSLIAGARDAHATALANDSRTLAAGSCFVALQAERDGHDFVADAFGRGATMALVTHAVPGVDVGRHGALIGVGCLATPGYSPYRSPGPASAGPARSRRP